MPLDDAIRAAAEQNGVQQQFRDNFGQAHATSPETNRAILAALGFDCSSEQSLAASMARHQAAAKERPLPPTLVISQSESPALPDLPIRVVLEDGSERSSMENLPLGYHQLSSGDWKTHLIVAPDSAVRQTTRRAGLGIMLYGLRSSRNWGCGDFRDLRDLIDWAVPALQADFIALNPLHALHNRAPYNTSPYLPNSIFYRNFIYLDIEAIPGYVEAPETETERARLRSTGTVDYEGVAALKRQTLNRIFEAAPPNEECRAWISSEGDLLRLYATYCALDEHMHAQDPNVWVWNDWPGEFQDPASSAVSEFARSHEREILFHGWVQWLIDDQIAAVQAHARSRGMGIGLYHDLALATDRCGSDLWAHRGFFISGARVGSPPDGFAPEGQDWSFPPPNQQRHLEDGYRLFRETIRKSMRHGGALRIDHVMRLFRLYWIPAAHKAANGAYVTDRAADLLRILALESVRNGAVIIGEDLGTVGDEVREMLARFGVMSYRLMIFEQDADGFRPPPAYPEGALVSTTTHDLPTITGYWTGGDIDARLQAGTIDQGHYQAQQNDRARDRQRLLDSLFRAGLLPENHERNAAAIPELTPELRGAILGFLAGTPSVLWLVNQEDITGEPIQQNLPGTTAEHPNWSRKMRWTLEQLRSDSDARARTEAAREWIVRSGRGNHSS